ncbi:MAG: hypothetical protein MJZ32_01935 [Bacteroidaceae bacterium]|nr:hypothetical protein [Bacteroidaceae bacterium]
MFKRFLYFFAAIVLMTVCQANSCSEHDEAAANAIDQKFVGNWCLVTKIVDKNTINMKQDVTTYWEVRNGFICYVHEASNGKSAVFSDGILDDSGVEWTKKGGEFEVTMKKVELKPYTGSYVFESASKFVMTLSDGTKLVFERINNISTK